MQGPPPSHCWHCNCRALAVIVLDSIQRIHHCDHLTIIQVALAMQQWFLWKRGVGWVLADGEILLADTDDTPSFSSFHSDAKLRALHNLSQFLHWRNCARAEICHKFKYKDFPVANSCHKYKYASPACLSLGTSTPTSSWLYATVTNSNTDTDTNAEMQKKQIQIQIQIQTCKYCICNRYRYEYK